MSVPFDGIGGEGRRPELSAVVMAAGRGTRMNSSLPKPLHKICGSPMLAHVLDSLSLCQPEHVAVVLPSKSDAVRQELRQMASHLPLLVAEQPEPLGTGDAAAVGLDALPEPEPDAVADSVMILPGDAPLLRAVSLATLADDHLNNPAAATLLTAVMSDPSGYGRVLRNLDGSVRKIVEQADATHEELGVNEVSTSVFIVNRGFLRPALGRIRADNAAGEMYLPDIVEVLTEVGHSVYAVVLDDPGEAQGVNTQEHLALARAEMRRRILSRWMRAGVEMSDPATVYIDASVDFAGKATLLPGTVLEGRTTLGQGTTVGPYTRLVDCLVGPGSVVEMSVCRGVEIEPGRMVGPFEHLTAGPAARSD